MGRSDLRVAVGLVVAAWVGGAKAEGQDRPAEASVQAVATRLSEFEETSVGVSARISYRMGSWVAADAELGLFPGDLGDPPFSASRTEGLLGVRVGPQREWGGVFAAVRPGFVRFAEAPEPIACILIFPPPLSCALAAGRTVFALTFGGGVEAFAGERTVFRVEVGDQLLRYPGPVLGKEDAVIDEHLSSHNLRLTASVGLRF